MFNGRFIIGSSESILWSQWFAILVPCRQHSRPFFFLAMPGSILGGIDNIRKGSILSYSASSTIANLVRNILGMKLQIFKSDHNIRKRSFGQILCIPVVPQVYQTVVLCLLTIIFDFHRNEFFVFIIDQMRTQPSIIVWPIRGIMIFTHALHPRIRMSNRYDSQDTFFPDCGCPLCGVFISIIRRHVSFLWGRLLKVCVSE